MTRGMDSMTRGKRKGSLGKRKAAPVAQSSTTASEDSAHGAALFETVTRLNEERYVALEQIDPVEGNSDVLISQWHREMPELELAGLSISLRIRRVAMLLDKHLSETCAQFGVKSNEMLLLLALRRLGPSGRLRPTDIFRMLSVTSSTVTYRIDQLIKSDLVQRLPDEKDRRGYQIELTPHGRKITEQVMAITAERANRVLAPLLGVPGVNDTLVEALRFVEFAFASE